MHRVEISRKRWGRGKTGGHLRNSAGLQCCLGFICEMAGLGDYLGRYGVGNSFPDGPIMAHWRDEGGAKVVPEILSPLVTVYSGGGDAGPYVDYNHISTALATINDRTRSYAEDAAGNETYTEYPDEEREKELIAEAAKAGYEFVFVE